MANVNLNRYFQNKSSDYYDSKYIITILEGEMKSNLSDIKNKVNNAQIVVSKEEIQQYLKKEFEERDPELKVRIASRKRRKSNKNGRLSEKELEEVAQEFVDDLSASRYRYEPFTLEYFKTYSDIVKNKALSLLDIIEKIGNKDTDTIKELISDLDIHLDENGNILKDDIIRLVIPTIYNITTLNERVTMANDLSTYLNIKTSREYLYKVGWNDEEIYPTKDLQVKDLDFDYLDGCVPLSPKQRDNLRQAQKRHLKRNARLLSNL